MRRRPQPQYGERIPDRFLAPHGSEAGKRFTSSQSHVRYSLEDFNPANRVG